LQAADGGAPEVERLSADYCREVETYLCRKNDGHLIRVVGPSFDLVSRWAADGVPLKVAFRGIDRYFERYYRKGPRRRPVRVDFCEPDVLDVYDEWRRAVGLTVGAASGDAAEAPARSSRSLPDHLERVLLRLTNARAVGALGADADSLIDRVSAELDAARVPGGVRGESRGRLIDRLAGLDRELSGLARAAAADQSIEQEAESELADFRGRMAADAFARARAAIVDRLARERLGLPIITF
jgi:hypothetical protein